MNLRTPLATTLALLLPALAPAGDTHLEVLSVGNSFSANAQRYFRQIAKASGKVVVQFGGQRKEATAGDDGAWRVALDPLSPSSVPGEMRITGRNTVVVWSNAVPQPAYVRYAWANNPECTLANTADLPAVPFRTDQ